MSNVATLTRRVKAETKCYGLWRKTSTAKSQASVSRNILSYLDENSKESRDSALAVSKQLGYRKAANGPAHPQLAGIDYLSKEESGKVRAYGFLRDDITRMTGKNPHLLDNDTRVAASHCAWMQRIETKRARKFGHKFVLSLDPRFCELMAAGGKDTDALLVQAGRTVLRRFQEKYYPGDKLGYLVGIHHDRQHIHAHILLYPYTESGKHLNVSNQQGDQRLTGMCKSANKLILDYFTKEFEYPIRATERPVDRATQVRLVSLYLTDAFKKTGIPAAEQPSWLVREQKRVLALPEPELRTLLTQAYESEAVRHQKLVTSLHNNPSQTQAFLQNIGERQTKLKLSLQHTFERTSDINERMTRLQANMQEAYKATANFKFYSNNAMGSALGLLDQGSPEQQQWLRHAMMDSTTGDTLQAALGELDTRKAPSKRLMKDWAINAVDAMVKRGILVTPLDTMNQQENNQALHTSRDFMRQLYLDRLDELKAERDKIKKEMDDNRLQRDATKLQLDTLKIIELEALAAAKGRKPLFLEQYEGLKRAGISLPVACRSVEASLKEGQDAQGEQSFEDINRRIMETLRAFQGERTKEAMLEVDSHFKQIVDATAAHETTGKRRRPAQDSAFAKELQAPGPQAFLAPRTRTASPALDQATAAATRHNADREFDL